MSNYTSMGLGDDTLGAARWALVQRWGTRLVSLAFFVVLARLLTPDVIGLVALASVFIAFTQVVAQLGFSEAIVQRGQLDDLHSQSAFWVTQAVAGLIALIVLLLAPFAAGALGYQQLGPILQVLAATLPLGALTGIQEAHLRRELKFRKLAVRSIAAALGGGGVGVAAAAMNWGVWSLVAKALTELVVGAVIIWTLSPWRPRRVFSSAHLRSLWHYGSRVTVGRLVDFVNGSTDSWVVGLKLGPTVLGVYGVAQRPFHALMDALQVSAGAVMLPAFSRVQADPERAARGYIRAVRLMSAVSVPCFASLAVLSNELVPVVFGSQWREASPILTVFSCGGIVFSVSYLGSGLFLAMGRSDWYMKWSAAHAAISVIVLLVAVRWGAIGVALGYVVHRLVAFPVGLWLCQRIVPFRLTAYFRGLLAPAVGGIALVATVQIIYSVNLWQISGVFLLVFAASAGCAMYLLTVLLLDPALLRELAKVSLGRTLSP